MKKLLLIIPLQLSLIFPNILMMQINHNSSNGNSLSQTATLNNTYDYGDQAMFNWENQDGEESYGFYTEEDLIIDTMNGKNGEIPQDKLDLLKGDSEIKIGVTNKTRTYYTDEPWSEEDTWGSGRESFDEDFNWKHSTKWIDNYYGIGFELKIDQNQYDYNYWNNYDLYISQTYDKEDTIGNYQKAKREPHNDDYYFYYDNWSGMMQNDVYLNFKLVDTSEPSNNNNNDYNTYASSIVYQEQITSEQINDETGLEKDKVNTYNNSFGINYDDVEYSLEERTHSPGNYEDWRANDYIANFDLKWNSQTLFWKDYFYSEEGNRLYFNAIYEIPIKYNDGKEIDVVGFTNNTNPQVKRNFPYDPNVDIKPEQNLEVNLELYSDPIDPVNQGSWRTYPVILGYFKKEAGNRQFIPITDKTNNGLISLDEVPNNYKDAVNSWEEPNEIHFILSNEKSDYEYEPKHDNLFLTNENNMNETILHNLINTNGGNIYEYPSLESQHSKSQKWTYATGYQNAFFIPEWDNVNHPKAKGSFYFVNLTWFIISLIISFTLLILISISIIKNKKKGIEEEG